MADDKFPSHKLDRYIVRLPDGMRERIAEAAAKAKRSMNAEIVQRLQESFSSNANGDSRAYGTGYVDAINDLLELHDLPARFQELALAVRNRIALVSGAEGSHTDAPSAVTPVDIKRVLVDNRRWELKLLEKEIQNTRASVAKMMGTMTSAGTADPSFREQSDYLRVLEWYAGLIDHGIFEIENPRHNSVESAEIREFPKGKKTLS